MAGVLTLVFTVLKAPPGSEKVKPKAVTAATETKSNGKLTNGHSNGVHKKAVQA
jgi:hypothetical protein